MTRSYAVLVAGIVSLTSVAVASQGAAPPPPPPVQQGAAPAQPPTGRGPAPLQNPNPNYASIVMTVDVNAPVAKVWARVGNTCDIGEWAFPGCTIVSGKDGELGAVRSIGNEILVAKTEYPVRIRSRCGPPASTTCTTARSRRSRSHRQRRSSSTRCFSTTPSWPTTRRARPISRTGASGSRDSFRT